MKSSLVFLGTAADSFAVGKGIRSSAGFLFLADDHQFHVDPGTSPTLAAKQAGQDLRATNAVFVTRNNVHHAAGLNEAIDVMTFGGFDRRGVLVAHDEVINGKEDVAPFLHTSCKDVVERNIVLNAGSRVGINDVEVQALDTTFKGSVGLRFFTPQFTIAYTGDTKYSLNVANQYKDDNILILNVPFVKKSPENNGLSIEDAIEIISKCDPNLAIITGFNTDFIKEDPIYLVRQIQRKTGVQTVAAQDGLVINPLTYSANKGQQRLAVSKLVEDIRKQEWEKEDEEFSEPNEKQQTLEIDELLEEHTEEKDSDRESEEEKSVSPKEHGFHVP